MKSLLRAARSAAPLMLMAALAGCDNPVSEGAHAQVSGVILRAGGTDLVVVTASGATGGISLVAGAQSPQITVIFTDNSGDEITPPSGYYLDVETSSAAVATWAPTAPGAFTGRIVGQAAGTASLEFKYMHGNVGSGHEDESFIVAVAVTAAP